MRTWLVVCLCVLLTGCAGKNHGYQDNRGTSLQYNHVEQKYEYAENDEQLKYNHVEDRYEYSSNDDQLRYNHIEDEYSYE